MKKQRSTLSHILEILSDGAYHDGTSLGETLQISRAAVWKNIQKLQATYNINVNSIKNKGYALREPFIPLNKDLLQSMLPPTTKLYVFESLPSTQTYLSSLSSPHPVVCLAEKQTSGKGRLGRHWYSPFGHNIYLSILYPFQKDISELSGLSLMVSMSILKAFALFFKINIPFQLKWPNDILLENKKLGGILIEMKAESYGLSTSIIGMGLNVNMLAQDDDSLDWISLRQGYNNTYINRNDLCQVLLTTLFEDLSVFQEKGFEPFQKNWPLYDALYNQPITLKIGEDPISGVAKGINELGHLLLEKEDKTLKAYSSGEASFIRRQNPL